MGVANPRDIKAIAKFVDSADSSVRTQAVSTMASVYKVAGDRIWTLIGEVPNKVKDMLT